jgi:hypothetical protein
LGLFSKTSFNTDGAFRNILGGKVAENQKPKIDQLVGIGNGKRKPIPIGLYQGIYSSEKHPNKDYALVRLPNYVKVAERNKVSMRIERQLHHVLSCMVLIPLELLRICETGTVKPARKMEKRKNGQ